MMKLKKIIALISTIVILISANLAAYADLYPNLAPDPMIESGTDYARNVSVSSEKALSGTKSLKATVASSWGHIGEFVPTQALEAGEKYVFSVWYYTDISTFSKLRAVARIDDNAWDVDNSSAGVTPVVGKWAKYKYTFTAPENASDLNYIYMCFLNGTGYGQNVYAYFDNYSLRKLNDTTTSITAISAEPGCDSAVITMTFNNEVDMHTIAQGLKLDGVLLAADDFDITSQDNKTIKVTLKKILKPLTSHTFIVEGGEDVWCKNITFADELKSVAFTTLPIIDISSEYKDGATTVTQVGTGLTNLSAEITAKNNTSLPKTFYVAAMVCEGQHINRVAKIQEISLGAGAATANPVSIPVGAVGENEYLRMFTWSSADTDLRALYSPIEFR